MQAITIGLDIAKSVFQLHGEDGEGRVVAQKRLGRKGMVSFFEKHPPASWRSRPAARRITGAERSAPWGTRSGFCRRLM